MSEENDVVKEEMSEDFKLSIRWWRVIAILIALVTSLVSILNIFGLLGTRDEFIGMSSVVLACLAIILIEVLTLAEAVVKELKRN